MKLNANMTKYAINNNDGFMLEKPYLCPVCKHDIVPTVSYRYGPQSVGKETFLFMVYKCTNANCSNLIYCLYFKNSENQYVLTSYYPSIGEYIFNQHIVDTSPRFVKLYNEAYAAEQLGHTDLAISGYRNCIEILIKDYAIKYLDKPREEVSKLKLFNAIKEYLPDIEVQNTADVVRIIGNDKTHFEQEYTEIDFEIFKKYLDVFLLLIEAKILANNPPMKR